MRKLFAVVPLLGMLAGCATPTPEEVAAATLYFPPTVKRTEEPRFCFTAAERQRALDEFSNSEADTLFELVIDADGKVRKARLIRTQVLPEYQQDLVDHAYWFGFTPDPHHQGYRAVYYPTNYKYERSFEWVGD